MHPQEIFLVAGIIEFVCGALIVVGLLGSWAAFLALGEMALAYFMAHFPRGESAVLLCFIFLYIAAKGSGTLSVKAEENSSCAARF